MIIATTNFSEVFDQYDAMNPEKFMNIKERKFLQSLLPEALFLQPCYCMA